MQNLFAKSWRAASAAAALSLLSGCMGYHLQVVSESSSPQPAGKSYTLQPTGSEVSPELRTLADTALKTGLEKKGFHLAAPGATADLVIYYQYTERSESVTVQETSTAMVATGSHLGAAPLAGLGGRQDWSSINGNPANLGTAKVTTEHTATVPEKIFALAARDNATRHVAWSVTTTSNRSKGTLRDALPILIAASLEEIGTSHAAPKTFDVTPGYASAEPVSKAQ